MLLIFFEAKTLSFEDTPVPLSAQMLLANAQKPMLQQHNRYNRG